MTESAENKIQFENFEWIDAYNPDRDAMNKLAEEFQLDYYQIKDSIQHGHLPKFEKLPNYNFLILRAFAATNIKGAPTMSEVSNKIAFFYNDQKLITVHRSEFDFLKNVKTDYKSPEEVLLFLVKSMVDTYQKPLNDLDKKIDHIEKKIFIKGNTKISLQELYFIKTQTRVTKKLLHIFQNVINQVEVKDLHKTALQDIKDRLLSLVLNYDEVMENAHNLLNTYLSVNAQKNNDVMKLLTIFSAFFLPLTFIVGVYGMNFENMPELKWEWGYFVVMAIMGFISLGIFTWFRYKDII